MKIRDTRDGVSVLHLSTSQVHLDGSLEICFSWMQLDAQVAFIVGYSVRDGTFSNIMNGISYQQDGVYASGGYSSEKFR